MALVQKQVLSKVLVRVKKGEILKEDSDFKCYKLKPSKEQGGESKIIEQKKILNSYVKVVFGNFEDKIKDQGGKSVSNLVKVTEISKGHLSPEWQSSLIFERDQETFLQFRLYQIDSESDQKYKQRFSWLKEVYQEEELLGDCVVDFSRYIRSEDQEDDFEDVQIIKKTLALSKGGVVAGKLWVEIELVFEEKTVKEEIKRSELVFYGFVAQVKVEGIDLKEKDALMQVRLRGADLDKRKKSKENLQQKTDVAQVVEKVRFYLTDQEIQQLSKIYFDLVVKEKDGKESVLGVTSIEFSQLSVGDNKINEPLFMSFFGQFSGSLFFEYVYFPSDKIKKILKKTLKEKIEARTQKLLHQAINDKFETKKKLENRYRSLTNIQTIENRIFQDQNLKLPTIKPTRSVQQLPPQHPQQERLYYQIPSNGQVPPMLKYSNNNLPENIQKLDILLKEQRQKNLKEFIINKKIANPIGNANFFKN